MTTRQLKSLETLVDLRERELDKLRTDMAMRQATRDRYLAAIDRMRGLFDGAGASGQSIAAPSPALSANCAAYKQALLTLTDTQRDTLSAHEADMRLAQQALHLAARRHEVMSQLADNKRVSLQRAEDVREQKLQDDMATQVWLRGARP
jgi:flagellar export protein FliJ